MSAFPAPVKRQLPRTWTERARRAAAELDAPGMRRRIGDPSSPVAYAAVMRHGKAWRVACIEMSICAVDGCEVTGDGSLVFDHCHDHGWLRGLVCCAHNNRLGQIDAVRRIPGVTLDLKGTAYAGLMAACPDCNALTSHDA